MLSDKMQKVPPHNAFGYVYLVKYSEVDYYKIGFSRNPNERIKNLETSSPFKAVLIHTIRVSTGEWLEWELHAIFDHKRIKLEWFALSEEDVEYIKSLPHEIDEFPPDAFKESPSQAERRALKEKTKSLHKKIESQRSHIQKLEDKIRYLHEKLAARNISTSEKELLDMLDQMRARIALLESQLEMQDR